MVEASDVGVTDGKSIARRRRRRRRKGRDPGDSIVEQESRLVWICSLV
jgi:hypothetical protein